MKKKGPVVDLDKQWATIDSRIFEHGNNVFESLCYLEDVLHEIIESHIKERKGIMRDLDKLVAREKKVKAKSTKAKRHLGNATNIIKFPKNRTIKKAMERPL